MKKATKAEKDLVIKILSGSFDTNLSVNYIIKQDNKREKRIQALMGYSFEACMAFGDVFLSEDHLACALLIYPDKRKTTLKSVLLDVRLILSAVGFSNISKTLKREKLINSIQPEIPMSYLWFIGVNPAVQRRGIGSKLLQEVIDYCDDARQPIYLETSTLKNLPWYHRFGFKNYHEEDIGYNLYFLSRPSDQTCSISKSADSY